MLVHEYFVENVLFIGRALYNFINEEISYFRVFNAPAYKILPIRKNSRYSCRDVGNKEFALVNHTLAMHASLHKKS